MLLSGGSIFFGSVVGYSLDDSGDAIHYDTALGVANSSSRNNYTPTPGTFTEVMAGAY